MGSRRYRSSQFQRRTPANEKVDDADARHGAGLRYRGHHLRSGQEGRHQEGHQEEEGQEKDRRREKGRPLNRLPIASCWEPRVRLRRAAIQFPPASSLPSPAPKSPFYEATLIVIESTIRTNSAIIAPIDN